MYPTTRGSAERKVGIKTQQMILQFAPCARLMRAMRQIGPPVYRFSHIRSSEYE